MICMLEVNLFMSKIPTTMTRKVSLKRYGVAIIGSSLIASSALVVLPAQLALAAPQVGAQVLQGAVTQAADDETGVLIARVQRDSPAAKAGLRRGDILLKVNDTEVIEPQDIVDALAKLKSGDTVKLVVRRGDSETTLNATAGDRNGKAYLGFTPVGQTFGPQPFPHEMPGMPFSRAEKLSGEIVIESVTKDSPADKAGLKAGDIIQSVDGKPLVDKPLQELIAAKKVGDVVTLTVQTPPDTQPRDIKITLGEHPDKKGAAYMGIRYRPSVMVFDHALVMPINAGAFVAEVQADSPADKAGVLQGDIITMFDGKAISDTQTLIDIVGNHKPGDSVKVTVLRGADSKELSATLGEKSDAKGKALLGVQLGGPMRFKIEGGPDGRFTVPFNQKSMPGLKDLFRYLPQAPVTPQTPEQSNL